jgi:hypothetical protein
MANKMVKSAYIFLFLLSFLVTACSGNGNTHPQAGATFSGELAIKEAGENGTAASGAIEFTISEDGKGIESLSYNLNGDSCTANGILVKGVGTSSKRTPPPEVKNGEFTWEDADVTVKGTFNSPTEASGTITITAQHFVQTSINSPARTQITCDYGTWEWTANTD